MDYNKIRSNLSELNKTAFKITDILRLLETGTLFDLPLTQIQVDGLKSNLKSEADNLKTIAGGIKTLVS